MARVGGTHRVRKERAPRKPRNGFKTHSGKEMKKSIPNYKDKPKNVPKVDPLIVTCNRCLKKIKLPEALNIEQKVRYRCEQCILDRG